MKHLVIHDLRVDYRTSDGSTVRAVDGVSLELRRGRTLGLVGESGSGKSSVARAVMGLAPRSSGAVRLDGADSPLTRSGLAHLRQHVQLVFQDPAAALNPRLPVSLLIDEAIGGRRWLPGPAGRDRVRRRRQLLDLVGLPAAMEQRYPHECSGGQKQRVAIARALAVQPDFVVLDEVTSALDASVKALIMNLLMDLQDELGLGYLFISHELSVVRHLSDDIAVMYMGRVVERASASAVFLRPRHPYSRALLAAAPGLRPEGAAASPRGEPGDIAHPPEGCRFHPRCSVYAELGDPRCTSDDPAAELAHGDPACFHPEGSAVDEGDARSTPAGPPVAVEG